MGVIVTFSYQQWVTRYPEFAYIQQPLAQEYFTEATMYQRNDGTGPVNDPARAAMLLNMLTAHIAALNAPRKDGEPAPDLVGRISSAGQGSVNVNAEFAGGENSPSRAWFIQTKYGAAWWQATAQFRTFRYRRARPRDMEPFPFA